MLSARDLSTLYDDGYFHGVNSGYPEVGYAHEHPTWVHWIEFLTGATNEASMWLDVGCAYGYLIREARERGVNAYGIDVSAYAVGQLPDVRERLVRALAERLPFADATWRCVRDLCRSDHRRTGVGLPTAGKN